MTSIGETIMTLEELKECIANKAIDTVLACIVDMQGRLMGKRLHAEAFLDIAQGETHCCNYLLATDLEMATPDGFASTSWSSGYGDYSMQPDLSTLRLVPWHAGTAMVLCDVVDHHTHVPVAHAPREMLKKQIQRVSDMGLMPIMATELEFFLFKGRCDDIAESGYQLRPISRYNEDYHILQTAKEEFVLRPVRNHLYDMGLPIEGTKGEAGVGQGELNIKYDKALATADHHAIAKHAIKEIAYQHGVSASFLAKWHKDHAGSSSHVHQSFRRGTESAFYDPNAPLGKSALMDQYLAGLLYYAQDYVYFLAPYINSYKRFAKGTFAPTRIVWSVDNRTAAFRLVGERTPNIRIECRIPGADMNPYLSLAAMLAAGLKGIEEQLSLPDVFTGDAYEGCGKHIHGTLQEAQNALLASDMLKEAFGAEVVAHYARVAGWEIEEHNRTVTDYEIIRGFERA